MVELESDHLLGLGLEIVGFKTCRIRRTHYKKNQHEIEEEPDAVWLLFALNWIRVYNMQKEKEEKRKEAAAEKKDTKKHEQKQWQMHATPRNT